MRKKRKEIVVISKDIPVCCAPYMELQWPKTALVAETREKLNNGMKIWLRAFHESFTIAAFWIVVLVHFFPLLRPEKLHKTVSFDAAKEEC